MDIRSVHISLFLFRIKHFKQKITIGDLYQTLESLNKEVWSGQQKTKQKKSLNKTGDYREKQQ